MKCENSQYNTPKVKKKVYAINEALLTNIKIADRNYNIIKEINNYLFSGEPTLLNPENGKPELPIGWFDKVIEGLNVASCRNTDIQIQLEKLQKEVIDKQEKSRM